MWNGDIVTRLADSQRSITENTIDENYWPGALPDDIVRNIAVVVWAMETMRLAAIEIEELREACAGLEDRLDCAGERLAGKDI